MTGRSGAAMRFCYATSGSPSRKKLIAVPGKPLAAFVCPGHPLLEATIDLIIERNRDLLKRGAVLVDESDPGEEVRTLIYLEHAIQDARLVRSGQRRIVSMQMQFVEIDVEGNTSAAGYAPYLNYRPLSEDELAILPQILEPNCLTDSRLKPGLQLAGVPPLGKLAGVPPLGQPAGVPPLGQPAGVPPLGGWFRNELESRVLAYAAEHLVPSHLGEVRLRKEALIDKTRAAVHERLTKEINYWDYRANQLKEQELAGKVNAKRQFRAWPGCGPTI